MSGHAEEALRGLCTVWDAQELLRCVWEPVVRMQHAEYVKDGMLFLQAFQFSMHVTCSGTPSARWRPAAAASHSAVPSSGTQQPVTESLRTAAEGWHAMHIAL
jgi:hypothetical protein